MNNNLSHNPVKRLAIVAGLIAVAFMLSFVALKNHTAFYNVNFAIAIVTWGWLFYDYKLLQVNRLYFLCLGFALAIFLYAYWLAKNTTHKQAGIFLIAGTAPLFMLLIQKPMRLAFIAVMKREPKIEKPLTSIADFLYLLILVLTMLLLPILYYGI